jgi:hypothetical protein
MRTFENQCAPSKAVRTFEPGTQGTALDPVPLTRKVVLPLLSAWIACLDTKARAMTWPGAFIDTFDWQEIGRAKLLLSRSR